MSNTRETVKLGNLTLNASRKIVIGTASFVSAAVLGIAAVGVSQAYHEVTVEADGVTQVIAGFYPNVQSALNAADVKVGQFDEVIPTADKSLANGQVVTVSRAAPYQVVVAGEPAVHWSSAVSLDQVFEDLSGSAKAESIVVSRSATRDALPLVVKGITTSVLVDGKPIEVELQGGETVAEVLALAKVTVTPIDSLRMTLDSGVPQLEVVTSKRGTVASTEEIPFTETEVEDSELEKGTTEVREEGSVGERTVYTYQRSEGGKVVLSVTDSEAITRPAVNRVIAIGTKEPVVVAPPAGNTGGDNGGDNGGGGSPVVGGDIWAALAQCESGGNPATNTGNGYYGLYQFSLGTWAAMGGSGLPSDASAAEQTQRAQALQAQSGWGQWPGCASMLGLL